MALTFDERRLAIRRAWLKESVPQVPFVIEFGSSHYASREMLDRPDLDLVWQEQHCRQLAEVDDYSLPNIKPHIGIGNVAAAFGCEWHAGDDTDPWVKPLIGADNWQDVFSLQLPDPVRSGMNPLALDRIAYFQRNSELPLRLVNVPSPLVTASLIWEYSSFLMAMMDHPRAVHALLDMVTEATIAFVKLQLERNQRLFALTHEPWYIPPELGIRISDDTAAVMSPRLYRKFGVPYNGRIAEAFGGLVLHSCGEITHVLPAMLETPGLVGIDFVAPQNDLARFHDLNQGQVALCARYYTWDFEGDSWPDLADYTQHLLDLFGRRGMLMWTQTQTLAEAKSLARELDRLLAC